MLSSAVTVIFAKLRGSSLPEFYVHSSLLVLTYLCNKEQQQVVVLCMLPACTYLGMMDTHKLGLRAGTWDTVCRRTNHGMTSQEAQDGPEDSRL